MLRYLRFLPRMAITFLVLLLGSAAYAGPEILWASDPVGPDETVLVVGDDFAGIDNVHIERLPNDANKVSKSIKAADVHPLQVSPASLKFTIPADFGSGVYRFALGRSGSIKFDLNTPSIYWLQGDLGKSSSPGGWVRVLGRNIALSSEATVRLKPSGQSGEKLLHPSALSLWDATFAIPSDLPAGSYLVQLWNGNGDASAWRDAGVWQVGSGPSLPPVTLNVRDFGAHGDGTHDDTASVKATLQALSEKGGGTLFLPRGYYRLSEGLTLPIHVRLKGEDRTLVRLIWPDFSTPPFALLEGSSDFAIEDVTIVAFNHGHIISGGFLPGSGIAVADARNIAIRRVTVRASMYRGHPTPEQTTQRLQAASKFLIGGPDSVRLSGQNITVVDSDIYGSGRSLYLNHPRGAYVARNKFYNGRWGWYSISGADGVIFENNHVIGADLQSTGGGVNTLSKVGAFAQNVAFFRNRFEMMYGWDREAMTSDGPGGCYYGAITTTGDNRLIVTLPNPASGSTLDLKPCIGAGIFIMGGRGMGQVRRIEAVDGNTIRLDRPFDVVPDGSSVATVTSYQRNYLMIGNEFADAGIAIQFFGSSVGHVAADNISTRTWGFLNRGLHYHSYQPTWYTQFLNNRIAEGDLGRDAFVATWGSQKPPNLAPLSMATIIRGNHLEGNAHIEVRGYSKAAPGVQDVVIENNAISRADTGILIDEGTRGVLLRKNKIQDVVTPINSN